MNRWTVLCLLLVTAASVVAQETTPDALAEFRAGRFEEAITYTVEELESNPNNIESYVVLGWSLNELGRYQDALDYGLKAAGINQFDHRILQIVAEAHFRLGNNLEALGYLERYVQVAPEGSFLHWVYFAMGEIFISFGEFHRADIALTTSVFHNSRVAPRWTRLGYAREQIGDLQAALNAYDRALQLDPNSVDAARGRDRIRNQAPG